MTRLIDDRLDDVHALAELDAAQMLRAVATSGAQIRQAATAAADAGVARLADDGRPRSVVVAGMGGSGIAGDVLAALTVSSTPVPVLVHRGPGLPGWVGAADLVVAASCSGRTRETLSAAGEAVRRGARLVAVAATDSPLADLARQARGLHVDVVSRLSPRSSMWALATPGLLVARTLGLLDLGPDDEHLEAAAARLELVAEACRPDRETFVNPAKELAIEVAGTLPMVWGAGGTGPVAAYRFGCQLAENAKCASVTGALPEAHHNQVVAFESAVGAAGGDEDFFRDRVDDDEPSSQRLRLVLVHDADGDGDTDTLVDASAGVAERHGLAVSRLTSEGNSPLERLASLVGLIDYTSVFLALGAGIDPTPIGPIDELKSRVQ